MTEEAIVNSFYITYAFLITTGTITFIEALRTNDLKVRTVMNLETCISIVATFFYGIFVAMIANKEKKPIDYKKINQLRYADWAITTPLMLLVLVTALLHNTEKSGAICIWTFLIILLLNYGMLGFGYLGDIETLEKTTADILGFLCFFALFGLIFIKFVKPKYNVSNYFLFFSFAIVWSGYGLVYFLDELTKNVVYNVLDLLSKAVIGILLWAFYTHVFQWKE
jgi:bacteriorhodopsin